MSKELPKKLARTLERKVKELARKKMEISRSRRTSIAIS